MSSYNKKYVFYGEGNPDSIKFTAGDRDISKYYRNSTATPFIYNPDDNSLIIGKNSQSHKESLLTYYNVDYLAGLNILELCNELDMNYEDLICGRFWNDDKFISFWDFDGNGGWKDYVAKIYKLLQQQLNINFWEWNLVADIGEGKIFVGPANDFLYPKTGASTSVDITRKKRNLADWEFAEYEGKRKYNEYLKNSPYADKRYQFALRENRKRILIKESDIRRIVKECVRRIIRDNRLG